MSISPSINNKYTQWLNSLPIAKNEVNHNTSELSGKETASEPTSLKRNASISVDKTLYSGEVVKSELINYSGMPIAECELIPSSQRDYTVGDALNYQYNKQFSFNLDDIMNGKSIKLRDPSSPIPQEFIDSLKQNGIVEDTYDASRTEFYLYGLDTSELDPSIDYLASGYAVSKQHIEDNFVGEEKTKALGQLTADFNSAVDEIANKTAKELGGFFEENGVSGETQKIYDSIIKAYNDQADKYSDYIKDGKDYANLNGTENEWLRKDDSYMACQLRKAVDADKTAQEKKSEEYYSLGELQKVKDTLAEIKSDSNNISCFDDEEKIGYQLAELALKGEALSKFGGVSESLKNAVSKSINNIVNNMTDKLNAQLKKARKAIAEPERLADLNKKDIFAVYNKVMNTYKATGDLVKALIEGAAFGENQHINKTNDPQYSNLNRYGKTGSNYWNNFFQNTLKYKAQTDIFELSYSNNGYIDKESGIETLSKEWNRFVSKLTDDNSVKFRENSFSIYA